MEKSPVTVPAEGCVSAGRITLPNQIAQEQAKLLKALADPNRLLLLFLIPPPPQTICVCDLTGALELSQPTVSHHLKVLSDSGFISRQKKGTWVHYSLVEEKLKKTSVQLSKLAEGTS